MMQVMLSAADQNQALRDMAKLVMRRIKYLVGEIEIYWRLRCTRVEELEKHYSRVEDRMLASEHSRKLEEALKDQRAQMEKKAVTKAEKDQVERTMAAFEINARFSDFATQWMKHRTTDERRRRALGRFYRKACKAYAEKLWVWRHTVLNLIEAAKELQMFTGNSDTGMRCPPEPDRNWFVMDDRELSKFVQGVHAEGAGADEPLSPLGQLTGGVGMKADAWMGDRRQAGPSESAKCLFGVRSEQQRGWLDDR